MPSWTMDDWRYLKRQTVTGRNGKQWSVALMDVLGQEGDPEMPNSLLEFQFSAGRFYTVIYSSTGTLQCEEGYSSLHEAESAYNRLVAAVASGRTDPSQPMFREHLED